MTILTEGNRANPLDEARNPARDRERRMLTEQPFPLLVKLATPSAMAFFVQASVSMSEVAFVGRLGTLPLAALAAMFPLLMLMQMLAGGALGGAVASAVARALGTGDRDRAEALVWHAIAIAFLAGLFFFLFYILVGEFLLRSIGLNDETIEVARSYGTILFSGASILWLTALLSSVLRGTGNMKFPSFLMIAGAVIQVPLAGTLILGWFGAPQLGIAGGAVAVLTVSAFNAAILLIRLWYDQSAVGLNLEQLSFRRELFADIFKVGAPASLSPLLTVVSIVMLNVLISGFGVSALAGYGIVARLEFLIIPMVFGLGTAMTATVGFNIGAGHTKRAEIIGWTGGLTAAGVSGIVGLLLAIIPHLWVDLFTSDPATREASISYLRIVGPMFAFQGLGLSLYFASQGAGTVKWPVIATILRFILGIGGAFVCVRMFGLGLTSVYVMIAAGMVIYGGLTAISFRYGAWRP